MPTARKMVDGVSILLMSDTTTGRSHVVARVRGERIHLGELFDQVRDVLHFWLSDPADGVEAWEPERGWPWRQRHATLDTQLEALQWLVARGRARGDL